MNKILLISILVSLASIVAASDRVDIVVLGMINHGPMQPTVNAIKNVTSKYGSRVNVTWIDLESAQGEKYSQEHDLTAHLNVILNGKYMYNINGKEITFQWFEGQQWTKEDLDTAISNILDGSANPIISDKQNNIKLFVIWVGVFTVIGGIGWFLFKNFRKG
jgi:hypothetical protein